jgi:hypothetical protein
MENRVKENGHNGRKIPAVLVLRMLKTKALAAHNNGTSRAI